MSMSPRELREAIRNVTYELQCLNEVEIREIGEVEIREIGIPLNDLNLQFRNILENMVLGPEGITCPRCGGSGAI